MNNEIKNNNINNSTILQSARIYGDMINNSVYSDEIKNSENKEYVFINKYCAVVAITDNDDKVIAYTITSLNENFSPLINLKNLNVSFQLGKSTFKEISDKLISEPKINGTMGANWFHYNEEYSYGRPSNYQTYIFSINENGILMDDFFDNPPFFVNPEFRDQKTEEMNNFRNKLGPNSFTVTAPFFDNSGTFLDYTYGPFHPQINLLPNNPENFNLYEIEEKIKLLYPESSIKQFIKLFGEPNFINIIENKK